MKRGTAGIICLDCGKYGEHDCERDPVQWKRDQFIGNAIAGLCASPAAKDPSEIARRALQIADAVMEIREPLAKPKPKGNL